MREDKQAADRLLAVSRFPMRFPVSRIHSISTIR